jgi:hypothetical protein
MRIVPAVFSLPRRWNQLEEELGTLTRLHHEREFGIEDVQKVLSLILSIQA